MRASAARMGLRIGGFVAGVLVSLAVNPPWKGGVPSQVLSAIVIALVAGLLGVVVADIARRLVPGQRQLDQEEEDALSEEEVALLSRKRLLWRTIPTALCVAFMLFLVRQWFRESPGFVLWMCFLAACFGLFVGEVILSNDPRQAILSRKKRIRWKRRRT